MKVMIRTLLGLAILAAVPSFADTDYDLLPNISGSNYVRLCRTAANTTDISQLTPEQYTTGMQCMGYTLGVIEGLELADKVAQEDGYQFYTAPKGVTTRQVMLITLRYIDQHPEKMHEPTAVIIGIALLDAYPPHPARQK